MQVGRSRVHYVSVAFILLRDITRFGVDKKDSVLIKEFGVIDFIMTSTKPNRLKHGTTIPTGWTLWTGWTGCFDSTSKGFDSTATGGYPAIMRHLPKVHPSREWR